MLITCQPISLLLFEHESKITLSVEEGEPGEEAACSDVSCVTYSYLLCGYVYVYHINSVSNTFHNHCV